MTTLNTIVLIIHIVSGYLALTSGAIVMFIPKGNQRHRRLGRVFFYSMLGVSFSAVYLAVVKDISFLLFIGIFVFYQVYAGFRSVKGKTLRPHAADGVVLLIALVNGIFMIGSFNVVLVVFGGISVFLVFTDLRIYYFLFQKKPLRKKAWLVRHISMMTGGYIGALTAFLVVNIRAFEPFWVIWLAPTFLLVPLMQYWTWKYTRKTQVTSKIVKE